jgi:AraC-like DNA-binding protein
MKSRFNLSALQESIADFYHLSGIRVSVFDNDFHEVCAYPGQRSPFCELARKNPAFDESCRQCDRVHIEEASKQQAALRYRCHAGLSEIIAPIREDDGGLIGFLFFSHMLTEASHEKAWLMVQPHLSGYGLSEQAAKAALESMPLYDDSYLSAAALVLQAAAAYLCRQKLAYLQQEELTEKIVAYIQSHLKEDLSVESLCNAFYLSRAALYLRLKDKAPHGVAAYIRDCRIDEAKRLLRNDPELRIGDVAESVGFGNETNFIVTFRSATGITPKRYALSQKQD